MNNLVLKSLLSALGVFVYVLLVGVVVTNGERLFGGANGFWGPVSMLLLLVLSVAVVGVLIFGKPVFMYLDGTKKAAWALLLYTIGWLAVIVVIALVLLATVFQSSSVIY